MRTFAVVNQKGGCGKTTTAINLAGVFAGRGYRTLLVDMDPQGHCAAGLAIPEQRVDQHIGDAMLAPADKPVDPQRLLWRVARNLDLAPATVRLAALEAARGELAQMPDAESRLKKVLARFDSQYDVCLIDCSPAIGMLAFNSMVAADEILIPVETGFFSLQGATKQINAIKSIGKRLGVAPVHRLLATMHDPSSVLSTDLLEELKRRFGNRVIPVVISHDHALREAASFGQPVVEYARESQGAKDYQALADWLIENSIKAAAAGTPASRLDDHEEPTPTRTPIFGPAQAAPTPSVDRAQMPVVQVIPGVAERTVLPTAGGMAAVMVAPAPSSPPLPSAPLATALAPAISRAADMAQRTRKLQRAVTIAEAKLQPIEHAPPIAVSLAPAPAAPARAVRDPFAATQVAEAPMPPRYETAAAAAPVQQAQPEPRRLFGVQATSRGVWFVQPLTIGQSVAIAGDFNNWTPERTPLRANPHTGVLEALALIPPGVAQYRLVVDGRWMPDPFNPGSAPNPFGGSNSVVVVPYGAGVESEAHVAGSV